MTRFLRTFLFVLYIGNAMVVIPRALTRFGGLTPMEMAQRVSLFEFVLVSGAYLFALIWVAGMKKPKRARDARAGALSFNV